MAVSRIAAADECGAAWWSWWLFMVPSDGDHVPAILLDTQDCLRPSHVLLPLSVTNKARELRASVEARTTEVRTKQVEIQAAEEQVRSCKAAARGPCGAQPGRWVLGSDGRGTTAAGGYK